MGSKQIFNILNKFMPVLEIFITSFSLISSLVAASELDTELIMRPLRNTERVLANGAVQKILEKEKALGDEIQITDIMDEVAGVYPKIMQERTMDAGAWSCGMVAGLIHDIPTCKELVERIVADAEEIIKSRLSQFVA